MEETIRNQIAKLATLKIKPYRKFIKRLLEIEDQGLVTEHQYREVRTLFQEWIMPYMKKENAEPIAEGLIAIAYCVGKGNESSRDREELRTPVFKIVNILMHDMGFGGDLNEAIISRLDKEEDFIFVRLFRQAIKENLDNVLVNHSDFCLLNRGVYIEDDDDEYIVFYFINQHPRGCKIMIGPFSRNWHAEILFRLYVPRYIPTAVPELATSTEISNFPDIYIDGREMPLSLTMPLADSCLIELEQEDCFNGYVFSFSFGNRVIIDNYRHNYAEVAFALGQRAKYIFSKARVPFEGMFLHKYIEKLQKIEPFRIYPDFPAVLDEKSGEFVPQ
jgi:hypothetical protein